MRRYRLTLTPLTAFGSALSGDTLFGQWCWALRHRLGDDALCERLEGYTAGWPFAVFSDAFPAGFLPRPVLPQSLLAPLADPRDRKVEKQKTWLSIADVDKPLTQLRQHTVSDAEIAGQPLTTVQSHNSINRLTGTTGLAEFAPFQSAQLWYTPGVKLDLYLLLDEDRLSLDTALAALSDIAQAGYGRDASMGLGKFTLDAHMPLPAPAPSPRYLTLAPCAPEPAALDAAHCHYHPHTRFGRHGDLAVRTGPPFKQPLLLLKTGATLALKMPAAFHGRGLGGPAAPISSTDPRTVHQGYAPLWPLSEV